MSHKFAQIAFTDSVRQAQVEGGSRAAYAAWDEGPDVNQFLGSREIDLISQRDSFYMAQISESGDKGLPQ